MFGRWFLEGCGEVLPGSRFRGLRLIGNLPVKRCLAWFRISNFLFAVRHEFQHIAVDAVAFSGWCRAVVKYVAKVDTGTGAAHLNTLHAV